MRKYKCVKTWAAINTVKTCKNFIHSVKVFPFDFIMFVRFFIGFGEQTIHTYYQDRLYKLNASITYVVFLRSSSNNFFSGYH